MKEEFLKIILITGLIIVFNTIPTSAIISLEMNIITPTRKHI